jgi:hypothetical protein
MRLRSVREISLIRAETFEGKKKKWEERRKARRLVYVIWSHDYDVRKCDA